MIKEKIVVNGYWKLLAPILMLISLSGCSTMPMMREDPLIGKIYHSTDLKEISYEKLLDNILNADVIYLGENHDNKEHHFHQIRIIQDLIKQGRQPRIGFEFFSVDQTGHLMQFVQQGSAQRKMTNDDMREQQLRFDLGWDRRSDESWRYYFQLLKVAAENGLTVFGADLPAGVIRRINRSGVEALNAVEKTFLRSTDLKDKAYQDLMFAKFKQAHCGFAHQKMMEKMYQTWLERNDAMADSIVRIFEENPKEPVVVILGKGHVEHNMGVYDRVHHRLGEIEQLNLGFTEIAIKKEPIESYITEVKTAGKVFLPAHEFVWFTQRSSYVDPCERFKEMFHRMKK